MDTYPDARLVLLHRDPVALTGSVCSLIHAMSSTFSDADHRDYIAAHWSDTLEESVRAIDDFRARRPDHPILDVHYADLARDPVGTARGIYDALGIGPDAGGYGAMAEHLARHPRGEFGGHRYDVAQFGLDEGALRERFQGYIDTLRGRDRTPDFAEGLTFGPCPESQETPSSSTASSCSNGSSRRSPS